MAVSGNLKIFLLFSLLFALNTKTRVTSWNDSSRMATIQSIVEEGSFVIDQSNFISSGDKYSYNEHFYSDKPPMLAIFATPTYFILHSLGLTFESHPELVIYLITLITIGLLSALGLTYFRRILIRFFKVEEGWGDLVTIACGTATLVFVFSIVFNNHMASGALIIIAFYYLLSFLKEGGTKNILISALLLSLAGSIDITCVLFLPAIGLSFLRRSWKAGLIFAAASLPVTGLYLFFNHYTSGSILPPAMNEGLWSYPGSHFTRETLSGLASHDSLGDLGWYAMEMIVGSRGLLSLSPILLFSVAGFVLFLRKYRLFEYRNEYILLVVTSIIFILSYIIGSVNYSGYSFGVRWFASITLVFCFSISFLRNWFLRSAFNRVIFVFILGISILLTLSGSYSPFAPGIDFDFASGEFIRYSGTMGPQLIIRDTPLIWKVKALLSLGIVVLALVFAIRKSLNNYKIH